VGEAIDVRRPCIRRTVAPDVTVPDVIHHHEDDVRSRCTLAGHALSTHDRGLCDGTNEARDDDRAPTEDRISKRHRDSPIAHEIVRCTFANATIHPVPLQEEDHAAAQGDRSENAEYIYGKRRLREIDRRVRFLSKRLDEVTVVTEPPSDPGRVFFGAYVTVCGDDGERRTYRIVGGDESDVDKGWISIDSPVARACLGKRRDDVVTVRAPRGEIEYTIVAVAYEP
jgi:transcription elongation factor GreB